MLYFFVKMLSRLACALPFFLCYRIGRGIGQLCWLLVPKKRKTMAIANVMESLGVERSEGEKIAKASAVRFGPMFMEVLRLPCLSPANISQYVELEGKEYLEEALSHGRGVVLATSHSGNWELFGSALALYGFPIVAVVQRQTNGDMDRFINESRSQSGIHVTYKQGIRDTIKLMNQNKALGIFMDQDAQDDGIFVEFFHRQAATHRGAAMIAYWKDAPIVPVFITQVRPGFHRAVIQPAIWLDKSIDRDVLVQQMTRHLTELIENHIRLYPNEWFWLHNRWKTRPEDLKEKT